jgi:hypothetical protein
VKQVFFFFFFIIFSPFLLPAQLPDTALITRDSIQLPVVTASPKIDSVYLAWLKGNRLLNNSATPFTLAIKNKTRQSKDDLFYLLATTVMLLALCRYFYGRYFTNLFRVFFNTSLRQSQITDQLLQAKLPSLLFNLFFVIAGGVYIYLLFSFYHTVDKQNKWLVIGLCIGVLGLIYCLKFGTLRFAGWLTGLKEITNTYIFIIFLINKIIGILLVPVIILLAFSEIDIANIAAMISLMLIGLLFLMRIIRSYGLLQNQLRISRFHFFLFIIGIELLPLLLIYKGILILLSKNL